MAVSPINTLRSQPTAHDARMATCGEVAVPAAPIPAGPAEGSENAAMETDEESLRLCMELQQQEMAQQQQLFGGAADAGGLAGIDMSGLDDETKASLELAMRLENEERQRMQEQQAAAERLAQEPEDAESIALAIRLQQEDDEAALRNALGVLPNASGDDGDEPGSPSQYSYEQLMMLGETVGEVSRGAKQDDITRLRVLTHHKCVADSTVILGEQCSICRMEFESDDELRVLPCGHAEHSECIDQWLAVNKSCPICMKEINAPPAPPAASAAVTDSACPTCPPDATPSVPASSSSQPVTPAEAPVVNAPPPSAVSAPVVSPTTPAAAGTPETPVTLA